MSWLAYALTTVVLWTAWSFLGTVATKSVTAAQATLLFGVATVVIGSAAVFVSGRDSDWSPSALGVAAISGCCGAAGMITFYLALASGKASSVIPVIGVYPVLVAVLAAVFLSERLAPVQVVGVVLAVLGVGLIGAGS